jgi:hypothetical protein
MEAQPMKRTFFAASVAVLILSLAVLAGCSAPTPPAKTPGRPGGPIGATRIAPGLYDLAGGTVQAVGTLEWRDLEGGFWAVTGVSATTPDVPAVVAVLTNAGKDDPMYTALAGQSVRVLGKRLSGVSVRMAGPEIAVTSITAFTDAGTPTP